MLPLLTTNAVIKCIHGGTVAIPPRPGRMMVQGGTVLCEGDLIGAPIAGCLTVPSTNSKPCTAVIAISPGSSTPKFLVGGRPADVATLQGVTDGLPPGGLVVSFPGQSRAAV